MENIKRSFLGDKENISNGRPIVLGRSKLHSTNLIAFLMELQYEQLKGGAVAICNTFRFSAKLFGWCLAKPPVGNSGWFGSEPCRVDRETREGQAERVMVFCNALSAGEVSSNGALWWLMFCLLLFNICIV